MNPRHIGQEASALPATLPYLLLGLMLGGAVVVLSTRALALPIAAFAAFAMIAAPRLAYYLLVATIPLYFGFASGIKYQAALMLPLLFIMLLNASTARGPWPVALPWPEGWLAIAFCIAVTASLFGTPSPYFSALATVGVYGPMAFIFFATLAFVRDRRDVERVLWLLVGVGFLEAVLAIVEARFGVVFSLMLLREQIKGTVELDGTLGVLATTWHPAVLGGFLMMTMPVALYLGARTDWRPARIFALSGAALMLYACWLTRSRLAFLAIATVVVTAVLVSSRLARYCAMALVGFLLVLLALEDFSISSLVQDFDRTFIPDYLRRGREIFNSAWYALTYRFETWGIAWNMFLSDPLFGVGMVQTARGWVPEFLPAWATTWGLITSPEEANAGITHNAFLAILAEHGIFAFAAFAGLWLWAVRCLVVAAKAGGELRGYALLLGAILAGQFVFMMLQPIVRDFSLTLALAAVLGRQANEQIDSAAAAEQFDSEPRAQPDAG